MTAPRPYHHLASFARTLGATALVTVALAAGVPVPEAVATRTGSGADTLRIGVPLPLRPAPAGVVHWSLAAADTVVVPEGRSGTIPVAGDESRLIVPLVLVGAPAAGVSLGRLDLVWSDGTRSSAALSLAPPASAEATLPDVQVSWIERSPLEAPASGGFLPVAPSQRDLEAEIYPYPSVVAPGGVVALQWTVLNFEELDQRIFVTVDLPAGWEALPGEEPSREATLASGDALEGELRIRAPASAPEGSVHLARIVARILGDPGASEMLAPVRVAAGGGSAHAGTLQGGLYIGAASPLEEAHGDPAVVGALDLSGSLGEGRFVTVSYQHGAPRHDLAFRPHFHETRFSADLRGRSWGLGGGSQTGMIGGAVLGPSVSGPGGTLRLSSERTGLRLQGVQPSATYGVTASGFGAQLLADHRVRDDLRLGIMGGYVRRTVLGGLRELETVGYGALAELQPGRHHRVDARGGHLEIRDSDGASSAGLSGELQYTLDHPRATLSARVREMPDGLPGAYAPSDELSADGALRLVSGLWLVGRGARQHTALVERAEPILSTQVSSGLRWAGEHGRVELRLNERETRYLSVTRFRTASAHASRFFGQVTASAFVEGGVRESAGTEDAGTLSARSDLRWTGPEGFTAVSLHYSDFGYGSRLRADLRTQLRRAGWDVEAGGWWTDDAWERPLGIWSRFGVPLGREHALVLGAEYLPVLVGVAPDESRWRFSLGARTRIALPTPFGTAVPSTASTAPPTSVPSPFTPGVDPASFPSPLHPGGDPAPFEPDGRVPSGLPPS